MNYFPLGNEYFFAQEDNLELVFEEQEKLETIYRLLQSADQYIQRLKGRFDTYEGCRYLWIQNIMKYAKEAYNSAKIGNFISLAIMERCIIENYVCACFIQRYEKERLWEKWFISSIISSCNMLYKSTKDNQKQEEIQKYIDELCRDRGISIDWDVRSEYGWTSAVLKKKKPTFYDLCEFVDLDIYKDYRMLCDFCHGVNAVNKIYRFTFVETYLNLLSMLVLYVQKSIKELIEDSLDQNYQEQTILFWNMMEEWE